MKNLENIMGVDEASKLWGLHPGTIKNLCADGVVIAKKIGNTWVIERDQPNPSKRQSKKTRPGGNEMNRINRENDQWGTLEEYRSWAIGTLMKEEYVKDTGHLNGPYGFNIDVMFHTVINGDIASFFIYKKDFETGEETLEVMSPDHSPFPFSTPVELTDKQWAVVKKKFSKF